MTTCNECKRVVSYGSHIVNGGETYDTLDEEWIEFCPKHARMIETCEMIQGTKRLAADYWHDRCRESENKLAASKAEVERLKNENKRLHASSASILEKSKRPIIIEAKADRAIGVIIDCISVIQQWHGQEAWDLYYDNAPEMTTIREYLEEGIESDMIAKGFRKEGASSESP